IVAVRILALAFVVAQVVARGERLFYCNLEHFFQGCVASDFVLALCSRGTALTPRSPVCLSFGAPRQAASRSISSNGLTAILYFTRNGRIRALAQSEEELYIREVG